MIEVKRLTVREVLNMSLVQFRALTWGCWNLAGIGRDWDVVTRDFISDDLVFYKIRGGFKNDQGPDRAGG